MWKVIPTYHTTFYSYIEDISKIEYIYDKILLSIKPWVAAKKALS